MRKIIFIILVINPKFCATFKKVAGRVVRLLPLTPTLSLKEEGEKRFPRLWGEG